MNSEQSEKYTLWLWPYFQTGDSAIPIVSGITRQQAETILEREKERVPGIMLFEPDGCAPVTPFESEEAPDGD